MRMLRRARACLVGIRSRRDLHTKILHFSGTHEHLPKGCRPSRALSFAASALIEAAENLLFAAKDQTHLSLASYNYFHLLQSCRCNSSKLPLQVWSTGVFVSDNRKYHFISSSSIFRGILIFAQRYPQ
ncbi:hypothetical protein HanIR_Chr10g0451821 [Helianthus annuus]|nr:hypothetical protein HanIR_Chr10g0451821 [Helianthus annuus]